RQNSTESGERTPGKGETSRHRRRQAEHGPSVFHHSANRLVHEGLTERPTVESPHRYRRPGYNLLPARLNPHRAELELRNLAVGIQLIDREHVGGGLAEVEGDEDAAGRDVI